MRAGHPGMECTVCRVEEGFFSMSKLFHIITDGSCDLPPEWAEQKGFSVVPFYVSFDDEHYCKEIEDIGIRDFYQQMVDRKGVYPKSSMPSTQDYVDAFMPWVEQDMPIICICITTKFSGSMQSAMNALQIIREERPQARIQIIDSTVNTVLQGILVLEVVKCQESGMTYEETIRKIEEIKSTGYGIPGPWRADRQGEQRGRKPAGDQTGDHVEAGRDIPQRHRPQQTQESGQNHFPAAGLSGRKRRGCEPIQYSSGIRV